VGIDDIRYTGDDRVGEPPVFYSFFDADAAKTFYGLKVFPYRANGGFVFVAAARVGENKKVTPGSQLILCQCAYGLLQGFEPLIGK